MVSQSNLKGTIEGVHFQPPDTLLDAEAVRQHIFAEPFYWRLPKQFQGDQVSTHQPNPLPFPERKLESFFCPSLKDLDIQVLFWVKVETFRGYENPHKALDFQMF